MKCELGGSWSFDGTIDGKDEDGDGNDAVVRVRLTIMKINDSLFGLQKLV